MNTMFAVVMIITGDSGSGIGIIQFPNFEKCQIEAIKFNDAHTHYQEHWQYAYCMMVTE